jgi:hypothetical protein
MSKEHGKKKLLSFAVRELPRIPWTAWEQEKEMATRIVVRPSVVQSLGSFENGEAEKKKEHVLVTSAL